MTSRLMDRERWLRSKPEAAFLREVMEAARLLGYLCYHVHDSRRDEAGYPDLVMVRDGRCIYAELKSERGKLRPAQRVWLDALGQVPGVEVYCWHPRDMDAILAVLQLK